MVKAHTQDCPVAAMLNLFGDHWTWLIIRESFYGVTRFSEFRRNTGIAKNLLSARLAFLVGNGVFEKRNISRSGTRYEYRLTPKGRSLAPVFIAMSQWGNQHIFGPGNETIEIVERSTGDPVEPCGIVGARGNQLALDQLVVKPGPGAGPATRKRLAKVLLAQQTSSANGKSQRGETRHDVKN
ncbi:MAG: winged helix-turn-helix transcriptional regulator [Rhizobiaceae bacterium]